MPRKDFSGAIPELGFATNTGDIKNIPDMSKRVPRVPAGATPAFDKLVLFICMTPPDKFFGIVRWHGNPICRE